jgi:ureidoacrylate peracid hydrolase
LAFIELARKNPVHNVQISPAILDRIQRNRGELHVFKNFDPRRTAHLIIDLQNGFMAEGEVCEIPYAREIVDTVNGISQAVRKAGGLNVFVRYELTPECLTTWSTWLGDMQQGEKMMASFKQGSSGWEFWKSLDIRPEDLVATKYRFSPFVPGASNLHEMLQERGIDTLIITGTSTNCCCESTARDAMQMNYKVIFVADGTACRTDIEQNATLNIMASLFADVMIASELTGMLESK